MFLEEIKSTLSNEINPFVRDEQDFTLASILVVIYGHLPTVVMTEKPKHMKFHAGEISFPGGKLDPQDHDLLETALRETREEIGLALRKDQVIGQLKPVITLNSGFKILPFVSVVDKIPPLYPNAEVETIFHIPLKPFLKTMKNDPDPEHNLIQEMYTFEYQDQIVWGASARVLKQLVDCLKP
jgi:8-oxo-dGTP pyrophosphatase MutT (NUDIX family)